MNTQLHSPETNSGAETYSFEHCIPDSALSSIWSRFRRIYSFDQIDSKTLNLFSIIQIRTHGCADRQFMARKSSGYLD